jgi:hypothetical protein
MENDSNDASNASNTMTITIYNFENDPTSFDLPLKELEEAYVDVISGDEIFMACYKDGHTIRIDSDKTRALSFHDGDYAIKPQDLKKWNEFKFDNDCGSCYGYQRIFDEEEREWTTD